MTKKEWIARYGLAHYEAHLAKSRAAAKVWYYAKPDRRKTPEQNAAAVSKWFANPQNAAKQQAKNRASMKSRYAAMTPEERRAIYEKRLDARRAKRAASAAYHEDSKVKQTARHAEWRHRNPTKRSVLDEKARESRRAAGKVNRKWIAFLRTQPCLDCGVFIEGKMTIGHLIPIARGGTNGEQNLVSQCSACNSKQHSNFHPRAMMVHYPQITAYAAASKGP